MSELWAGLLQSRALYAPERAAVEADPLLAGAVVAALEADLRRFASGCLGSEERFPSQADYVCASEAMGMLSDPELAAAVRSLAAAELKLFTTVSDCTQLFLRDPPEDWGLAEGAHAMVRHRALLLMGTIYASQPDPARSQQLVELLTRTVAAAMTALDRPAPAGGEAGERELKLLDTLQPVFVNYLDQRFLRLAAGDVSADDCKAALGILEGFVRVAAVVPTTPPTEYHGVISNLLRHFKEAVCSTESVLDRLIDNALADQGLQRALISLLHSTAKMGMRLIERSKEEADCSSMDLMQHTLDVWCTVDELSGRFTARLGLADEQGKEVLLLPSMHKYVNWLARNLKPVVQVDN